MTDVRLIGVPFDGYGRPGNQALAAAVLREAGLAALPGVTDSGDLELPPASGGRGDETSLVNEPALVSAVEQLRSRVRELMRADAIPLVVGGDCSALLGIMLGARAAADSGLLFIDAHEDTMPLDVSEDGEAANTEIGLLLGITGGLLRGPLQAAIGVLPRTSLAVLGVRDAAWRRSFNVASVRDLGVHLRDWRDVRADPVGAARCAVDTLRSANRTFWLHVDLDVLDPEEFGAQGLPDVEDEPGGLRWNELTILLTAAVKAGGCAGLSVAIYDPDQDVDRTSAARIVALIADVLSAI